VRKTAAINNFKFEISDLINRAINISRQLYGWIESLKNTEIKGAKYLNDKTRKAYQQKKGFEEFDREMAKYREDLLAMLDKQARDAAQVGQTESDR